MKDKRLYCGKWRNISKTYCDTDLDWTIPNVFHLYVGFIHKYIHACTCNFTLYDVSLALFVTALQKKSKNESFDTVYPYLKKSRYFYKE